MSLCVRDVIIQVVTSSTLGSNQSVFLIKTSISHLPWTGVTCGNDNFMKIDLKATARMSDYSNLRVVEASSRIREVVEHANKLAGIIK